MASIMSATKGELSIDATKKKRRDPTCKIMSSTKNIKRRDNIERVLCGGGGGGFSSMPKKVREKQKEQMLTPNNMAQPKMSTISATTNTWFVCACVRVHKVNRMQTKLLWEHSS